MELYLATYTVNYTYHPEEGGYYYPDYILEDTFSSYDAVAIMHEFLDTVSDCETEGYTVVISGNPDPCTWFIYESGEWEKRFPFADIYDGDSRIGTIELSLTPHKSRIHHYC